MALDYKDLSDDELASAHETEWAMQNELEEQRKSVREKQVFSSERIAAIEQEQAQRRKAGYVTGEIGG